ncbi:hypothetical protein Nepgr_014380 [Nepenthes gracilis]|uniref:CCR4-NOT transcription complex subunit 4 n=1 Tax=Nepenthes gracilis TaxID=150966 RepID=A0AAD3XQ30_NEPGR|nr:hypothetical protein Nepgr_014380 [Nepenthes gracilis]
MTPSVQNLPSEMPGMLDNWRLREAVVDDQMTSHNLSHSHSLHLLNHDRSQIQHANTDNAVNYKVNPPIAIREADETLATIASSAPVLSYGNLGNYISCTSSIDDTSLVPNGGNRNQISRFDGEVAGIDSNPALDMETSVISNILSLDLEAWDDSSPQNLAMLLGEPDKQHGSVKLSGSLKTQSSNQSRFSFARQGNSMNQLVNIEPSFNSGQESMSNSFSHAFVENREPYMHGIGNGFGFCEHNAEQIDKISSIHSITSCNKPSVSRAQLSAPPGFSMPSRPPLSGFSSQERNDQTFDVKSGSQLLDTSLLRNPYMTSPSGNTSGAGDIEFIDPAILAVGKGRLPSGAMNNSGFDMQPAFPSQLAAGNDAKLQLLMQSSLTPHQNLRYVSVGDSFLPNDSYGFASRHMEQSQTSNLASFSQFSFRPSTNAVISNGQWDGWSEHQALNDVGMAEILTNGRLKFNRLYNDFEDKFQKPSAANLYSRTFGI